MASPATVRAISSEEFNRWQPALKVIAHAHARRFAAIALKTAQQEVAIAWRSDSIEPTIVLGNHSESWLGVDQRIACIASDGRILVSLGLASFLLDIRCFRDCVAVVCETQLMLFNDDSSIRGIHALSDLPNSVTERGGVLFVTFDDGREERIG